MSSSAPAFFAQRAPWRAGSAMVFGALVVAVWLWRMCYLDPAIRFLAPHSPAEWIVFPKPANFDSHAEAELAVQFRQQWNLASLPSHSMLTYRAFRKAAVILNGTTLPPPPDRQAADWKSPVTIEVTRLLQLGPNEIIIAVDNQSGPPALWAWLDVGAGQRLISDEHWQASYAGSMQCPVRLATEPLATARDGTAQHFSDLSAAWRTRWLTLLGLTGLSALGVASWSRWRRFTTTRTPGAGWKWLQDPARVVLAGAIILWIALFWHNLDLLPRESGFDAPAHGDYIRYIMERHSLPLANEGGVMYNPPLYYAICAGLLGALSLPPSHPMSVEVLRGLALAGGIAQLLLVAASLRLLFPDKTRVQAAGIALAAALPPSLYLSHYVTNEWLVAVLVTGTIYLCLRVLRSPHATVGGCVGVGACLGAALLTKFSALLVAPLVVAAVAFKVWRQPDRKTSDWWRTLGGLVITCSLVCGWHYLRVWQHFGKPLVGSWESESGFHWWQDQGYLTFSHFLRFGNALMHPAFSARTGFWDGIYSTLWADGLCGGRATGDFRPPWDYGLMALGSSLASGLMLAILAGACRSSWRFVRQPTPERLLLNGLAFGFLFALLYLNLTAPYYAELKAFYGLLALLPLCVFGAEAWEAAGGGRPWRTAILSTLLGLWALCSFATYWIPSDAAQTHILLGSECANSGQLERAVEHFTAALKDEPGNVLARSQLASGLAGLGRSADAQREIERNLTEHPDEAISNLQSALIAPRTAESAASEASVRRALVLAPDCVPAHSLLLQQLQRAKRTPELITAGRDALRVDPFNSSFHFALGVALSAATDPGEEAREQLRTAARLAPTSIQMLNNVAWILSTHASPQMRDGAAAVQLSTQACKLTENPSVISLLTLAAAQAEDGRYEEAVTTALLGQKTATDTAQPQLADQCAHFAAWFRSGKPFHLPPAN